MVKKGDHNDDDDDVLVATLGMFIIDTFRFEDEKTGESLGDRGLGEQVGGGGTYWAIGARVWMKPEQIMMTIDRGNDFTQSIQDSLDAYSIQNDAKHSLWRFRQRPDQTTKAVNIYRGEERGFAYLSKKIRLDPIDLLDSIHITFPPFIHCICSPERAIEMVKQIKSLPQKWSKNNYPNIVWEPIPDCAIHENLDDALEVSQFVAVLSPNHEEAASFLGIKLEQEEDKELMKSKIESIAKQFYHQIKERVGEKQDANVPIICIRSGAFGALICIPTENGKLQWMPAYHTSQDLAKIVDVTGAGNAWMGGFTAGLALSGKERKAWSSEIIMRAASMASISAALTIEQTGLPKLTFDSSGKVELWNEKSAAQRLQQLNNRVKD